jgi:hypothetical protein
LFDSGLEENMNKSEKKFAKINQRFDFWINKIKQIEDITDTMILSLPKADLTAIVAILQQIIIDSNDNNLRLMRNNLKLESKIDQLKAKNLKLENRRLSILSKQYDKM